METFCNRFVYISGLLDQQRQIQKSLLFKFILLSNISLSVKKTMSFDSTRFQPTTIMDSVSIPKNEQRFRRDLKRKLVTCNHFIQENPPQSFCAWHARENLNLTMKRITGIVTVALNN